MVAPAAFFLDLDTHCRAASAPVDGLVINLNGFYRLSKVGCMAFNPNLVSNGEGFIESQGDYPDLGKVVVHPAEILAEARFAPSFCRKKKTQPTHSAPLFRQSKTHSHPNTTGLSPRPCQSPRTGPRALSLKIHTTCPWRVPAGPALALDRAIQRATGWKNTQGPLKAGELMNASFGL